MAKIANTKFYVGQLVHHRLFEYRGVIVGVDPFFDGEEHWYEEVARTKPPKNQPWYHILVDDGEEMTYVAERNVEADDSTDPIRNPMLREFFDSFEGGRYCFVTN